MHLDEAHVLHPAVKKLEPNEIVTVPDVDATQPEFLEGLEEEVLQAVMQRQDEFVVRLIDQLMLPPPVWEGKAPFPEPPRNTSGMGEYICRKHGHQGYCARMYALRRYTMLCINYHHARKRFRWEGARKDMRLVCLYGGLKAEARVRYYGAECTCLGLDKNTPFEASLYLGNL